MSLEEADQTTNHHPSEVIVLEANRKYKDGLFRAIFNEPEKALKLYNDKI